MDKSIEMQVVARGKSARPIAQRQQKMRGDMAQIVKEDKSRGEACGKSVEGSTPSIWQLFIRAPWGLDDSEDAQDGFKRTANLVRQCIAMELKVTDMLRKEDKLEEVFFALFLNQTIVYKGIVDDNDNNNPVCLWRSSLLFWFVSTLIGDIYNNIVMRGRR